MPVNLQIKEPLSKIDQVIRDENGVASTLAISTDSVSIGTRRGRHNLTIAAAEPQNANAAQLEIEAFEENTNPLDPREQLLEFRYYSLVGRTTTYGYVQSTKVDVRPETAPPAGGGGGLRTFYAPFVLNPLGGNIGIGTVTPSEALEVKGNVLVSGDIMARGDVRLLGADCAENFDVDELQDLEPGSVMVIGDELKLYQCAEEYDKRVAGVLSGAGIYRPGIVLDQQQSSNKRMPLALTGKVYCKVDAQYSPINIGDLLTTSPTLGHAMKALDPLKAFGAVIGKALRPLTSGQGLIPVLVALQ